ncbi:hypothetical protein VRRI112168_00225 [Vreelandella rituensis]|uniref:Toxin co-regulated pilus biosynthesis protein Q C-terminal domain-containing protein n=1 Tax=Vreelandella rituensis TaxID=2282306 RepID=A0A368UB20_9GAMM|nr:hypothetical protein [Halomonas rituensis]RCV93876.1 hypothetical protein DU506_01580 [Halomonas rituensis]
MHKRVCSSLAVITLMFTSASHAAAVPAIDAVDTIRFEDSRHYDVRQGWLSESVKTMAAQAGYSTLIWTPDPEGKLDFNIPQSFRLKAPSAVSALTQLMEPYPVRLCLYTGNGVAQVLPQGEPCL